jgi:hypothetical protein
VEKNEVITEKSQPCSIKPRNKVITEENQSSLKKAKKKLVADKQRLAVKNAADRVTAKKKTIWCEKHDKWKSCSEKAAPLEQIRTQSWMHFMLQNVCSIRELCDSQMSSCSGEQRAQGGFVRAPSKTSNVS